MKHSLWAGWETINHFIRSTHGWWQNFNATQRFIHTQEMPKHIFLYFPSLWNEHLTKRRVPWKPGAGVHFGVSQVSLENHLERCQLLPISRQRQKSFKAFDFLRGKTNRGWTWKWDEAQLEICDAAPSPLMTFKLNYYPCFVEEKLKNKVV